MADIADLPRQKGLYFQLVISGKTAQVFLKFIGQKILDAVYFIAEYLLLLDRQVRQALEQFIERAFAPQVFDPERFQAILAGRPGKSLGYFEPEFFQLRFHVLTRSRVCTA